MTFKRYMSFSLTGVLLLLASVTGFGAQFSCYELFHDLQVQRVGGIKGRENTFAGTFTRIVRAFEKEGLFYGDIVKWFD